MPYPLCQHIMSSGWHCCSPALTGHTHCYYHDSLSRMLPKPVADWQCYRNQDGDRLARIPIPLLEDASSLQTAYMQIVYGVLSGELGLARSRVALSALKAAARNLDEVKREQSIVAEVAEKAAERAAEDAAEKAAEEAAASGRTVPNASDSPQNRGEALETAAETEAVPLSYEEFREKMKHPDALVNSPLEVGTEDPPRKQAAPAWFLAQTQETG